ncbi:MAG: hypothetical protein U1F54_14085 [Burkholderiales bacterium]
MNLFRTFAAALVHVAVILTAGHAVAQSDLAVPPLPPVGPYVVGCSNLEQDFSRVQPGESVEAYWEGLPRGDAPRFVTDLLVDPSRSLTYQVTFPGDSGVFGSFAGRTMPYVLVVCYPTEPTNTRPDYPLPTGNAIPRMQRGGEAPLVLNGARWPAVLYSHGLSGSPISGDYIKSLAQIASYGYVTIGVFHGDLRFADLDLAGFDDYLYALLHYRDFIALQAVRPLSLSRALDVVLADAYWRDHIDTANIAGFGASLGGESLLLLAGAKLTTSLGLSSTRIVEDKRLKAAVGYVPYFGVDFYPAFGRDSQGLDGVSLPFLAISGTADTTAPIGPVEQGMRRLTGTRQLVAFTGLTHGYDARYASDLDTWMFTFLGAQTGDNPPLRATSARMTSVAGGMEDVQRIDYMAPVPLRNGTEAMVVEYYNGALAHFFMTADPAEAQMLDAGVAVPGWRRTGMAFKTHPAGAFAGLIACRFFGTPPLGPNSHFYTIDAAECAKVKANPLWTYEGIAFNADPLQAGTCGSDRIPVLRLYNNGMGGQANHRYTTSRSEARAMAAAGWIVEGYVFCAVP